MNRSNARNRYFVAVLSCLGLTAASCTATTDIHTFADGEEVTSGTDNDDTSNADNGSMTGAGDELAEPSRPSPAEGVVNAAGTVEVTLHPVHANSGEPTLAGFGVPFPRGVLSDIDHLVVLDEDGRELSSHVRSLVEWRTLGGSRASDGSVRSAAVFVEVEFSNEQPLTLQLAYDGVRSRELGEQGSMTALWQDVSDDDYAIALPEPSVYATLPPAWLGACELRTATVPTLSDSDWGWFDDFLVGAARTATNDVANTVTEEYMIDLEDNEPWLFDRTLTLFGVYTRTGDVTWLRRAHRSAQFYLANFTDDGYFAYKYGDLKYIYNLSMLVDMMLTGDESLLEPIELAAETLMQWDPVYTLSDGFWTERHQTYALLGALAAWEATGDAAYGARAQEVANASFANANNLASSSWNNDGCMLHTMRAHEGDAIDQPVCSPWMNGLFASAMWRYYGQSLDIDALEFLADLGSFIAEHGLYDGSDEGVDYLVPWYLVSSSFQYTDSGPWADREHTCDVANVVARGAWAKQELGEDPSALADTALELLVGCRDTLEYWHRPGGVAGGRPEYRLTPARKFNWWFGSTLDMPWIFDSLGVSPV
ncbi:hypothetical protein [Haliangium ochraceum]|uniref:Lipoprotein n=1 Tax=Haliangium ochraceum (strain DSM 14365 / JCM 11303 / SMP-2) TaxID=502025 RepID=D0LGX4_HALO1|nr:hypothetical protein [Haliangium ochraceum]ACY14696.1 hypothetical protein Hoch_2151 [Haliangium ochraceum DSM 14365]